MADDSYSISTLIGDGETLTWPISFAGGFLSREHIRARYWPDTGPGDPIEFTWVDNATLKISPPVAPGVRFMIYRSTPKDKPLADFADGAFVTEADLDTNARQAVFIAAEAIDQGNAGVGELNTRAILVPVGEVAPHFPPRQRMRGKLVGVDLAGNIVPVGYNGFDSGDDAVLDAALISFEGANLRDKLLETIDDLTLSHDQIAELATSVTDQGDALTATATDLSGVKDRLTQLKVEHEALTDVVDALSDLGEVEGLATLIQNERSERVTADGALAAQIAVIGASNGDNTAFILNLDNVKVTPTETLAERLEYLDAEDGEAAALIQEEKEARIAGDAAEATARTQLGTSFGQQLSSAIQSEQQSRASAIGAEAAARTQLATTLRGETDSKISSAISSEAQSRVSGDQAEALARQQLATTLRGETTAAVQAEASARTTALAAEAQARETLGVTLGASVSSQVQSARDAAVTGDNAIASVLSLIGAKTSNGSSFQLDMGKVLVEGGLALGSRLSGIDTSLGNTNAAIASEITTRNSETTALAQSLGSISASVGGLTSSVTTMQSAINGISAKAGIALDVNGYVTGWIANNNGSSGNFTIIADRFSIVSPSGAYRPFEVVGNLVYINGSAYRPGSITPDKLSVTSLSALTADIGFLVSYNGQGGRVERDGNGTRIYDNNGQIRLKSGF